LKILKKRKKWPWVLAIVGVISIVAAILIAPRLQPRLEYETYEANPSEVVKTVAANGELVDQTLLSYGPSPTPVVSSQFGELNQPAQFAPARIETVSVRVGQQVSAGQELFSYLDASGLVVRVTAKNFGVVRGVFASNGTQSSGPVVQVGAGTPAISVWVSEYDADRIRIGQVATVTLDALELSLRGRVFDLSETARNTAGIKQYQAVIEVTGLPRQVRVGMSASAAIVVESKSGVLAVPTSALIDSEANSIDLLIGSGESQFLERVELEFGLVGDSWIEVLSGLSEGDLVVTGVAGEVPGWIYFGPPPGVRGGNQ
jgi:multidrug efflux pump subunit AcrA (membrane-fusion protein)